MSSSAQILSKGGIVISWLVWSKNLGHVGLHCSFYPNVSDKTLAIAVHPCHSFGPHSTEGDAKWKTFLPLPAEVVQQHLVALLKNMKFQAS